ncbi:MAG: hypothetical protein FWB85_06810, partial [Chitinispirillia bacterium]|nr:hypothetical protein [Chitinispirillia bacterium]MCL2241945.1 hypothetical protein [Chitinispirillia bacterium]
MGAGKLRIITILAALPFCALFAEGGADSTAAAAGADIAVPERADSVAAMLAGKSAHELNAALREEFNKRDLHGNRIMWGLDAAYIEKLLAAGADPNTADIWGEPIVRGTSNKRVIELLLRYGADTSAAVRRGGSELMDAGDKKETVFLIHQSADPNKPDSDGRTEMHRPYLCDGEIRALAEAGGDVNAVCGKGLTPLMYAVSDYEAECV